MIQSVGKLVQYIDHTLLKPEAVPEEICRLCQEAVEYSFKAVCVNAGYVKFAAQELAGSEVLVASVIGFPLGATTSEAKAAEAAEAVNNGADELDMVINIGRLKAGDYRCVQADIARVVEAASGTPVKVIIETALLIDEEKERACRLSVDAGAAFVKTSTGFAKGGATVADVRLMRRIVGEQVGVKASGGVRSLNALEEMIAAGATRIGTSSGMKIVAEFLAK